MKYGDKRNYPKIDVIRDGQYECSTTWACTCKEAVERYKEKHPYADNVTATFTVKKARGKFSIKTA